MRPCMVRKTYGILKMAVFHKFVDHPGSMTRALVEYEDGTLEEVKISNVTFIKKEK